MRPFRMCLVPIVFIIGLGLAAAALGVTHVFSGLLLAGLVVAIAFRVIGHRRRGRFGPPWWMWERGPGPWGSGSGFWRGLEWFELFTEEHLDVLKDRLKITPEQEATWTAFATEAKNQIRTLAMGQDGRDRQSHEADVPMPERVAQYNAGMKERLSVLEKLQQPFTRLYEVLTPEQRKELEPRGCC